MTDHPAHRRIAKANEVNAERLARLIAFVNDPERVRPTGVPELYDGPEPHEDHMTPREMDRRAGWHFPEGP
jgi:hypothetical protein